MEPVYLLLGQSVFLIKKHIKTYQLSAGVDPFNIITLDANETEIDDIVQELNTVSLFGDLKMIIVENIDGFTRYDQEQLEPLIKYLEKPSQDVIIIFSAETLPKDHLLSSVLEKYAYIENVKSLEGSALPIYVKKAFDEDGYIIDGRTVQILIDRAGTDMFSLHQEIDKLKAFAVDSKTISTLDVESLVPRSLEDNIFAFSSAYLRGDTKMYMQIYDDLLGSKMQSSTLLTHLFKTVNLILQAQNLLKQGYSQESIANYLSISSGQAYYVVKEAKVQKRNRLEKLVKDLAKLDVSIKTGMQDDKLGFELLLLGNLR